METRFIGRTNELALLNRLWESEKSQFLVLYGRRRVGKTSLLAEWISRKTVVKPEAIGYKLSTLTACQGFF